MTLQAPDDELVDTCVRHHSDHLEFRRSLRMLTFQEARVRHARAATRLEAIEEIRAWRGEHVADDARMALDLIQLEWLADSLAEGEMADMGLDEAQARRPGRGAPALPAGEGGHSGQRAERRRAPGYRHVRLSPLLGARPFWSNRRAKPLKRPRPS